MTTTLNQTLGARIAAALDLNARATEYVPADNPFVGKDVDELAGSAGFPALNMAAKTNGAPLAQALEESLHTTRAKAKDVTAAKRQQDARNRARKKAEFDAIADRDIEIDQARMMQAWRVVFPLVPVVTREANAKRQWAERHLGTVAEDVAQTVLENMALLLAKSDHDLLLMAEAADDLGRSFGNKHRKGKPVAEMNDDERKAYKAAGKRRKWLLRVVHNRITSTMTDLYTSPRNVRWDNVEIVGSVMASINGVGGDPLVTAHKASRAPGFLGTRFQRPDGIDQGLIAAAINAAITDRGLDLMVEMLLNQDLRRSNGSVAWAKLAERLFLATPDSVANGQWLWDAVVRATEHHERPNRARADAARTHVRNLFEWLPGFIVDLVNSFDFEFREWSTANMGKALLTSDFEAYLPEDDGVRRPFVPALVYASVEEAVAALTQHIDVLTGTDLMISVVNA